MINRVSLAKARKLINCYGSRLVDLREISSSSGKFRVVFCVRPNEHILYFSTDYLTSKTSYRFMCSLY